MISPERPPTESITELEAQLSSRREQVAALEARLPELDAAIVDVGALVGEVEQRLSEQGAEVARLRIASGKLVSFGRPLTETVLWTDGNGTRQLSGPKPLDSPEGKAEHAKRVYDALEAEATPVRGALVSLQGERQRVTVRIGLLGHEIHQLEHQVERLQAAERERVALIGKTTWRERLAATMRRLASA